MSVLCQDISASLSAQSVREKQLSKNLRGPYVVVL